MRARRATTTTAVVLLAFLSLLGTGTYTVRRGDTLSSIAKAHGTTTAALVKANGLDDADHIVIGQRLEVAGSAAKPASATARYTVVRGDTLGSIASRHGSSVAALVSLNKLKNANLISIGQVLLLPAPGGGTSTPSTPSAPKGIKQPAGGATTHVVKAGETVSGIAARHGIPVQQLIDANGIVGNRIYTGQRLLLVPPSGPGSSTSATTYTVRAGDTLSGIAARVGVTLRALQAANGITNPNLVRVGQTLKVPAGGKVGAIACPVTGVVSFMNDWGFPRSGGRFHEGNDLFAPRGRAVVATVGGNALHTTSRLGGNQVKLQGDDGVSYYYTHLGSYAPGGRVKQGQVIGYVGSSGNAAGGPTHVHFEIHPGGGAAVNPYPILAPVCRR